MLPKGRSVLSGRPCLSQSRIRDRSSHTISENDGRTSRLNCQDTVTAVGAFTFPGFIVVLPGAIAAALALPVVVVAEQSDTSVIPFNGSTLDQLQILVG